MVMLAGQPSTLTLVIKVLKANISCSVSGPSPTTVSFTMLMNVQDSGVFGVRAIVVGLASASARVVAVKSSGSCLREGERGGGGVEVGDRERES